MAIATVFNCPSYSGMLYTKSNTKTPFLNSIGKALFTRSSEFPLNQAYALGTTSQPSISDTASMTAPSEESVSRTQATNVTQIFQRAIGVSYLKMSSVGLMSGVNNENQTPDPQDELTFQISLAMQAIANDIEYTFLNGEYAKATNSGEANKTRGIITACTTNTVTNTEATALTKTMLKTLLKSVFNNGGTVDGGILMCDATQKMAITGLYEGQTGYVAPLSRNIGGMNIDTLVTDFGNVGVITNVAMPAGTILFYNPSVCRPVEQAVPNKGNFFYESLAKTGAAERGQLYGQIGLDYGPEWFHGVIKGLA